MGERVAFQHLEPALLGYRDELRSEVDPVCGHTLLFQELDQLSSAAAEVDHPTLVSQKLEVARLTLAHSPLGPEALLERDIVELGRLRLGRRCRLLRRA